MVGSGPLQASHLPRLELLDATIKEALRMRPASPGMFRKTTAPFTLGDCEVPTGTVIMASSYLAHMQEEQYPEPGRFDPKRFFGIKPDAYAWIPFGGGARRCIGMAYALYEMKIVCATVLSQARLRLADERPVEVTCRAVFHSPARGLRVLAQPSQSEGRARVPSRAARTEGEAEPRSVGAN